MPAANPMVLPARRPMGLRAVRALAACGLTLLAAVAAAGLGAALDSAADSGCAWGSDWMIGLREWLPTRSQALAQDLLLRSFMLGTASVAFVCGAAAVVVLPVLAALDLAGIHRRRRLAGEPHQNSAEGATTTSVGA